jgi:hypothetical protein
MNARASLRPWTWVVVVCLLVVLALQLALSVRRQSQTWDEGAHLFAGYSYWKHVDFGRNPEHPPLVKLLAALPLLRMDLKQPIGQNRGFKIEGFLQGRDFLYGNNAESMLFHARMAAAVLTLLLALVVFLAANEMFGLGAGFIALLLIVFEPNILAHGALVTTDIGAALFIFATIYFFYRYVKSPTWARLIAVGLAAGLALAAKHSGVLVFPMLVLLAIGELIPGKLEGEAARWRLALRQLGAIVLIGVIAVTVLWSFYGFRYNARPDGLQLDPPLADKFHKLPPSEARVFQTISRAHILPEAYLYGLSDVRELPQYIKSYVFGRVYPHGVWFYFPAALAVKSTLAFLLLILLTKFAVISRRLTHWRELLFLSIPPLVYLLVAMTSGLNLGIRHILAVYVFLAPLVAGAAWALIERDRRWAYAVAILVLFHAVSSVRAFPNYLTYANEAFGGPANTYKYLSDSNVDWGQQLKSMKHYVDEHRIRECWFAYFAQTAIEPNAYGVPCKPMPTVSSQWLGEHIKVPATIDGPVFISAGILSGYTTGDGALNPYDNFRRLQPTALIDNSVFVFDGHFDVPLASAITHTDSAYQALAEHNLDEALAEGRMAVSLAPQDVASRACLGDVLTALNQPNEARQQYEEALALATANHPEFQAGSIWFVQQKMKALGVK